MFGVEHRAASVKEGILLHTLIEYLPLDLLGRESAAREHLQMAAARRIPSVDESERQRAVDAAARFAASNYASTIRGRAVRIEREWPFAFAPYTGTLIRGTLDWLAELDDGTFEIIDYKSAQTPEIDRYVFQIAVYRAAITHMFQRPVRAGLIFLGAAEPEPQWIECNIDYETPLMGLIACRTKGHFPLSRPAHCRTIGCGYLNFCHEDESHSGVDSLTE